jgi:Putative cyclase
MGSTRVKYGSIAGALVALSIVSGTCAPMAMAQTREKGPWWPNAQWGAGDQAGASNWITPEKVLAATALVKTGRVIELGHLYERGMPLNGNRSYNIFIPSFPTHGPILERGVVFNDEFVASEIGQVGTQFDGPGHVGQRVKFADGSESFVFYNGATSEEMRDPYGLKRNGVENVKPILTRAIYLDLAAFKEVATLPEKYQITLADVRGALAKQGLKESDIAPGDALLFNTGWWRLWPDPKVESAPHAYAGRELIDWIIARKPSMIGSDSNFDGPDALVHTEVTMKNGIWNLENMDFAALEKEQAWRFMFVFTPLRLKGATGSPGRPIAVL